jgi:epoxyqueuosine reductase QueG
MNNPAAWITTIIQNFIEHSPENTLQNQNNEKAWGNPLLGFSRGDDPLYEEYKKCIGPFHWTPDEIFSLTFPQTTVKPKELTVISWILPQTKATKTDNRKQTVYPAERWARSRIFGEQFNNRLRQHVEAALKEEGYEAVAPMLSPHWETKTISRFGISSAWSERHAAYASGLGTFGLCDGLITPVGKAMRTGAAVARIQIPPTPRPYTNYREYCLFFTEGSCGECISRCPVGAITKAGHNKGECRKHLRLTTETFVKTYYGFDGYGCGLCQTGVPCESKIPKRQKLPL